MGLFDLFRSRTPDADVLELARRLGLDAETVRSTPIEYREFSLPKRSGGRRRILAPAPELKSLQRRIDRRLLALLVAHPAAHGFERMRSIVTNAAAHSDKAVVVRMDIRDFFASTRADRVERLFRALGWSRKASDLLTRICTCEGRLPAGAPTSPRLSNLVNVRLDTRLAALAARLDATYTRYADDMTFSFGVDERRTIHALVRIAHLILVDEGYELHMKRKLHIRRRHQQQLVTGLVVNRTTALPRRTRRWLRAVEHYRSTGRQPSLTDAQLAGWRAFARMVARGPTDDR